MHGNSPPSRNKAYMCLLGGILVQLFNGCYYLWANLSIYVLSYIYKFDPEVNASAIFYVDVVLVLLKNFGFQFGAYLLMQKKFHVRTVVTIGGCISLTGIIISSFVKNLWLFIIFYGGCSGIGGGIMYMSPLICGWEHFPERKGLITGIIVGAYGMGTFIFSQVSTLIINPNNEVASIKINANLKYFDWEVASRVPFCLRVMSIIWGLMLLVGVFLLSRPAAEVAEEDDNLEASRTTADNSLIEEKSPGGLLNVSQYSNRNTFPMAVEELERLRTYDLKSSRDAFKSVRFW